MGPTLPRVAVVTGGGTGIGKGIARALATDSQVVILGRRVDVLRGAATELGPHLDWEQADVGNRRDVERAVAAILERHGRIDILVNNAGFTRAVTMVVPMLEAERVWDELHTAVLKGSFLMSVAVAAHLPRPGGRIIMISSIAAYTGGSRPGAVVYASAKAGLHGLVYGFARELSPHGITVNAIAPGFIAGTEFTGAWPEERVQGIIAQTPAGRAGTPDDVAGAVRYLASPEASFVTGEILNVNGGWIFGH